MIAVAGETIREIVRRRFAIAALLATLGVAAFTGWGFWNLHHLRHGGRPIDALEIKTISAVLVILIAYLFSFILAFAATLVASPMLSTEIESGVLLPVLARPVSRAAIVCGKALGLALILCAYASFSGLLEFAVVRLVTGYQPPHPLAAIAALAVLSLVMLALTLAIGTRLPMIASSIVGVVCFGIAWMAGIVASIGPVYHNELLVRIGVVSQLLLPTDAMWRTAVFALEPAALVASVSHGGWPGPFIVVAPPPLPMEIWTGIWIVAVVAIAARSFSTRDV